MKAHLPTLPIIQVSGGIEIGFAYGQKVFYEEVEPCDLDSPRPNISNRAFADPDDEEENSEAMEVIIEGEVLPIWTIDFANPNSSSCRTRPYSQSKTYLDESL